MWLIKHIKKIIKPILLSSIIWLWMIFTNVHWFDYEQYAKDNQLMTKTQFMNLFNEQWNLKIWCYTNWKITNKLQTLEAVRAQWITCRGRNIIIPNKKIAEIFWDLYADTIHMDVDPYEVCWDKCITMISNRFALINFESWFNPDAKSPTNDYWIIQVNNWKEFLWFNNIKKSLQRLDNRWINQRYSLCVKVYKINQYDDNLIYRCLLMRHNWRRTLYNDYTNKAYTARNYYMERFYAIKKEL